MGKYLVLWEIDETRVQISPQERGAGWAVFMDIIHDDIKEGTTKDWGSFVGEMRGYSIMEGTEVEVGNLLQRFVPFVKFKVHAIATVEHVDEIVKALNE
ncbi:MAG: hypothetical protein ACXADY_04615 [Candidatus Hodarchaeales archaeon]|jgi:hypothetical protein